MTVTVSILKPQDEESWNKFVFSHPSATVYHALEWRYVSKVLNHQPLYLIAKNEKGHIEGVLPLFFLSGLRGRRLVSIPLRDRGGPLCANELAMKELLQATKDIAVEKNCRYIEIKTVNGLPEAVKQLSFIERKHYLTTVVFLDPDIEKMWKSLDYGSVRWAIRKAEKNGVRVRWGESNSDIYSFYEVFLQTRRRLGVPPYSVKLFEEIWNMMGKKGRAGFLLALCGNRVIGGIVLFNFKDTVIEAYAACDQHYLNLCANDLMLWEAFKWAATNGYHYFDFGASSPYQKGLRDFKLKWGGRERELPFYFYLNNSRTVPLVDSNTPDYQIVRRLWSKMPVSFTRTFGPFLTRQMD